MYIWTITYVPQGCVCITQETQVTGNTKLEAQQYFSKYYLGKIINIEKKSNRNY